MYLHAPTSVFFFQIKLALCYSYALSLSHRIPVTRFFTTKYPQPIVLSSGTSLNLPVTFRPLEKVCDLIYLFSYVILYYSIVYYVMLYYIIL